ncbi:MAG TPA: hypothetical protein VHL77_06485, partial [Ferruginibacter sp.]|nr:hypothetical protein [Ferruginibacter sp.]
MIIAVNTRLEKEGQPAGYENFLFGILDRLTKKYTQHKFIFICDKPDDNSHSFPGNVQIVVTGPETKTNLRIQYWFNYKVPAVLQKYKADVFVSLEGIC